jgi:hypothetical protein
LTAHFLSYQFILWVYNADNAIALSTMTQKPKSQKNSNCKRQIKIYRRTYDLPVLGGDNLPTTKRDHIGWRKPLWLNLGLSPKI